jgi:RNA polymerase sigma factor (sigma-70 family)
MRQILPRKLHTEADVETDAHKDLFLRYYQPLFRLALRLTGGSRARAEDLLHDAFIHFMLSRPDLNSIDNFDRYLNRSLLNLFRTQKRKAAQMQDISFNIADYDSAKLGLHAIDFQDRWQAQEDLIRICHYACVRKETSRAGSVLILRFFYDYSPSEIAKVTLSPRRAVDDWLRLARREARSYLEDPERLKFMAGKQGESYRFKTKFIKPSDDIVYELRTSILRSGWSDCLSKAQLRALYQESGQAEKTIDCATLGHIVSCAGCLDRVNHLLGLPSLSARQAIEEGRSDPDDPDESDKGDGSGTGAGIGPSKAFIDRCEEQIRQIREHRPEELLFSANGDSIGALKINSELSELRLSIHDQSPVEFIEVYSERGMRLILFSLEHGENAPVEQLTKIELSDGRTLELIFRLGGTWPSLQVIYRDPLLQEADYALNDEPIGAMVLVCDAGPLSGGVGSVRLEIGAEVAAHTAEVGSEGLITRLSRRLRGLRLRRRRISRLTMLSTSSESQAVRGESTAQPPTEPANAPGSEDPRFKELRVFELGRAEDLIRGPLCARPGFITALLSVLLVGALLYLWMPGAKPVTAASLLERAKAAEEKLDSESGLVQHRMLDLEERIPKGGKIIARRKIQIWQSGATRLRVRRLYDERQRLTAGEWKRADGSRTIYRRGTRPQTGASIDRPLTPEDLWQIEPSARDFMSLVGRPEETTVAEQHDIYLLNYEDPAPKPARSLESPSQRTQVRVLKATLALRKSDLRAIDQTLLVDVGRDNPQLREVHFHESGYEGLPAEKVQPETFEPEPELIGPIARRSVPGRIIEVAPQSLRSAITTRSVLSAAELAAIEVDVLHLLDQVGANLGEQVSLARLPDGVLRVEALLDTDERKEEILRALQPVSANPAVRLKVQTFSEALAQQQATAPRRIGVGEIEILGSQIPAYDDVRRYLAASSQTSEGLEGDAGIRRFADRILDLSSKAMSHVWALKRLGQNFPPQELAALTPEARAKWLTMISGHAYHFGRNAKSLCSGLAPIFFPTVPCDGTDVSSKGEVEDENDVDIEVTDDASLTGAINRLFELAAVQDQEIRSAFTRSNESGPAFSVKAPNFRHRLRRAERLATYISEVSRQSARNATLKTQQ